MATKSHLVFNKGIMTGTGIKTQHVCYMTCINKQWQVDVVSQEDCLTAN